MCAFIILLILEWGHQSFLIRPFSVLLCVRICKMYAFCTQLNCWHIEHTSVSLTLQWMYGILTFVYCCWFLLNWQFLVCLSLLVFAPHADRCWGVVAVMVHYEQKSSLMASELVAMVVCHHISPPLSQPAILPIYAIAPCFWCGFDTTSRGRSEAHWNWPPKLPPYLLYWQQSREKP